MITKKQYDASRKQLEDCQNLTAKYSREGNQLAIDKINVKAVKALALIVRYRNQHN